MRIQDCRDREANTESNLVEQRLESCRKKALTGTHELWMLPMDNPATPRGPQAQETLSTCKTYLWELGQVPMGNIRGISPLCPQKGEGKTATLTYTRASCFFPTRPALMGN